MIPCFKGRAFVEISLASFAYLIICNFLRVKNRLHAQEVKQNFMTYTTLAALKFCFKSCVATKLVDDDYELCCF